MSNIKLSILSEGTPKEVLESLKAIVDGIEDAIESEENTLAILDGVDNDLWDIKNINFNISN